MNLSDHQYANRVHLSDSIFLVRTDFGAGVALWCTRCEQGPFYSTGADDTPARADLLVDLAVDHRHDVHGDDQVPGDPRYSVTDGRGRVWPYIPSTMGPGHIGHYDDPDVGLIVWDRLWLRSREERFSLYLVTTGAEVGPDVIA